jgi:hypothetical protein
MGAFDMMTRFCFAAAVAVMACLQASLLLAEDKPAADAVATPAPAASAAPSPAPISASSDRGGAGKLGSEEAGRPKAAKRIKMSTQTRQELDHSIKTRTVPSRYRSQVPKEYQKYIPFDR